MENHYQGRIYQACSGFYYTIWEVPEGGEGEKKLKILQKEEHQIIRLCAKVRTKSQFQVFEIQCT